MIRCDKTAEKKLKKTKIQKGYEHENEDSVLNNSKMMKLFIAKTTLQGDGNKIIRAKAHQPLILRKQPF